MAHLEEALNKGLGAAISAVDKYPSPPQPMPNNHHCINSSSISQIQQSPDKLSGAIEDALASPNHNHSRFALSEVKVCDAPQTRAFKHHVNRAGMNQVGCANSKRATSESALSAAVVHKTCSPVDNSTLRRTGTTIGSCPQISIVKPSVVGLADFHQRLNKKFIAFFRILRRVLANPIWFGVTFTSMVEQSIVAAFLAFAAKYIQDLFQVPAYLASIHTGAVVVPSSVLGVLSGALLMRHFRPRVDRTLAGIAVIISITVVTTVSLMLIKCPGNRVAGLTATYGGEPWPWMHGSTRLIEANLTAPCNLNCGGVIGSLDGDVTGATQPPPRDESTACSTLHFNPVCWKRATVDSSDLAAATAYHGPDYLTYYNPCFAGCRTRERRGVNSNATSTDKFFDCSCVTPGALNPSGSASINGTQIPFGHVTSGRCQTDCPMYAVFLAVLFMHILFTGMLQNPSNVITLSCVSAEDSAVALGLQIFFMRTLAYIPAPIYFGQLFDLVCQYRLAPSTIMPDPLRTCTSPDDINCQLEAATSPTRVPGLDSSRTGACLQYNLEGLPLAWLGLVLALKVVSLIGALLTWNVARRQAMREKETPPCEPPQSNPVDIVERDSQPPSSTDEDSDPTKVSVKTGTTQTESLPETPDSAEIS